MARIIRSMNSSVRRVVFLLSALLAVCDVAQVLFPQHLDVAAVAFRAVGGDPRLAAGTTIVCSGWCICNTGTIKRTSATHFVLNLSHVFSKLREGLAHVCEEACLDSLDLLEGFPDVNGELVQLSLQVGELAVDLLGVDLAQLVLRVGLAGLDG